MDGPKVKWILIGFLLLVNLLIGSVYLSRCLESETLERRAAADAAAALKRIGVDTAEGLLDQKAGTIYTLQVERDRAAEFAAFETILGETASEDQGSGIYLLTGKAGTAKLSGNGGFSLELTEGYPVAASADGMDAALEIFLKMGIRAEEDLLVAEQTEDGWTVDGMQTVKGKKIFNRTYSLSFDGEGLQAMSGERILAKPLVCDATPSRSVATALFAFVGAMQEIGTPCTEILRAELGYYAKSSAPGYTQIQPVWEIESDLGVFYVDAITLELFRERDMPK